MDKPLDGIMNVRSAIGQRVIDHPELPAHGISTDSQVYTEVVIGEGQLKRGTIAQFGSTVEVNRKPFHIEGVTS